MRKTRLTGTHNDKDKSGREHNSSFHSFVSLSVCALTVIAVTGGCKLAGTEKHKVYAASENESSSLYSEDVDYDLPSGIAGVVSGVNATPAAGSTVNRIGISCDDVIVGQRVRKVTSSAVEMNVSESMAMTVDTFDAKVVSASSSAKLMSDEDYENLLQIVEQEQIEFVYGKGKKKPEIQQLYEELEACGERLMGYKECFMIMGRDINS